MIAEIATAAAVIVMYALAQTAPPLEAGYLSRYDQTPSKYTLRYRVHAGDITAEQVDAADVYVAALDCGRIGETGVMSITNAAGVTFHDLDYLVYDCAGVDSVEWMQDANILFEVNHRAAVRYLGAGAGWGVVYD